MSVIILLTLSFIIISSVICENVTVTNYCRFGNDHILCGNRPRNVCRTIQSGVSSSNIADILTAHNNLRSRVATGRERFQPPASNMREITWNEELAVIAQRIADQCSFELDYNRKSFRFPRGFGQNLAYTVGNYFSNGTADFIRDAILMWYKGVSKFDPRDVARYYFNQETGLYTQVVWAESHSIGCGYSFYNQGGLKKKLYVCNYGESGNILGASVYKIGKPCSACPRRTVCSNTYPGLCSPSNKIA